MAAKKTAAATGKSMTKWDEKLAALAAKTKQLADTAIVGTPKISVRGGAMTFRGQPVPGNKLRCVVIDYCEEKDYYEGDFDPDTLRNPVCFALTQEDAHKMVPHELSTDKQHDKCEGCPKNKWGSADKGKGKACKDTPRLILIPEDALKTGIGSAEVALLNVPVTSGGNWRGYVDGVRSNFSRPPLGVITEISCAPHAKNQVEVSFKCVGEITNENHLGQLLEKQESVNATLMKPYEPQAEDAPVAKPKARGKAAPPAKKPGGKARR